MKKLMQWLHDVNGQMAYEKGWDESGHVGRN